MVRPAVFLDRDGVLVEERSYVLRKEELNIFPYTYSCVQKIKEMGYYAICISNQSAVGRGMMTILDLQEINAYLKKKTGIDAVYCCPHYWKDNIPICNCRKPHIGLFEQAMRDFQINLSGSYMVGDRAGDILSGKRMGLKTVLLESGYGSARLEQEVTPDFRMNDLQEFVLYCIGGQSEDE